MNKVLNSNRIVICWDVNGYLSMSHSTSMDVDVDEPPDPDPDPDPDPEPDMIDFFLNLHLNKRKWIFSRNSRLGRRPREGPMRECCCILCVNVVVL